MCTLPSLIFNTSIVLYRHVSQIKKKNKKKHNVDPDETAHYSYICVYIYKPAHDKTYDKTCATSEDRSACESAQSDQSLH